MADIFISYKSERRPAARHLAEILGAHGFSVWFDHALVPGSNFGQAVEKELRTALAVVVIWCSRSIASEWVQDEADLAKKLGKSIPIRIEECDPPLGFRRDDYVDLVQWDGNPDTRMLDRLIDRLEILVGRKSEIERRRLIDLHETWVRHGRPSLNRFDLTPSEQVSDVDRRMPSAIRPTASPSIEHRIAVEFARSSATSQPMRLGAEGTVPTQTDAPPPSGAETGAAPTSIETLQLKNGREGIEKYRLTRSGTSDVLSIKIENIEFRRRIILTLPILAIGALLFLIQHINPPSDSFLGALRAGFGAALMVVCLVIYGVIAAFYHFTAPHEIVEIKLEKGGVLYVGDASKVEHTAVFVFAGAEWGFSYNLKNSSVLIKIGDEIVYRRGYDENGKILKKSGWFG